MPGFQPSTVPTLTITTLQVQHRERGTLAPTYLGIDLESTI